MNRRVPLLLLQRLRVGATVLGLAALIGVCVTGSSAAAQAAHPTGATTARTTPRPRDLHITFGTTGDTPVPGRWASGTSDSPAVFRQLTGYWYLYGIAPSGFAYGSPGDTPAPADYNADGTLDAGVFRPSTGTWYLRGINNTGIRYGSPGDTPVPGDYDADGTVDLAVYRPTTGVWYVRGVADAGIAFGAPGDVPLARKWVNGSAKVLPTVFRPSSGRWYVRGLWDSGHTFGSPGDTAVGADFGGTDAAERSVFRPSNGRWYDTVWMPGGVAYGSPGDTAVAADYDGDGHAEPAVFRPSTGQWFVRSGSGTAAADPVVIAAGDIACTPGSPVTSATCQDAATAALIPTGAAVLALGDLQYEDGAGSAFASAYASTWGTWRGATFPAVGNHEYVTPGATGYRDYFGTAWAAPTGHYWYSTDVGAWHVVVLDSNCTDVDCTASGNQVAWLSADLAAHPAACTLAIWHHPRFSSGSHGDNSAVGPFWDALIAGGADLVLNGHDHDYERFAAQRADATPDANGLVEVVVGTGGKNLTSFGTVKANSTVRDSGAAGVLKLTLAANGYSAQMVGTDSAVRDSFSGTCH